MVGSKRPPEAVLSASQWVVGYSGGLDSTVLCHQLLRLSAAGDLVCPPIVAVHVHHGLQADADRFAAHCQQQAKSWGLSLEVVTVNISADDLAALGTEAAARRARSRVFAARVEQSPGSLVVLAHHLNDQVETALLQWIRGAGLEGLTAMESLSLAQPLRPYGVWRPLLEEPRQDLLNYAQAEGLVWVEDPTNASIEFDRNRLRTQVIPVLEDLRSGALGAMGRSIAHLQAARRSLAAQALDDLASCRQSEAGVAVPVAVDDPAGQPLQLAPLLLLGDDRMMACLRLWMREAARPAPPARRLEEFCRQLRQAGPESRAQLAVRTDSVGEAGGFQVRLRAGILTMTPLASSEDDTWH